MTDTTTRVVSLRRYVSLLRQEEKRLKWISGSPLGTTIQRSEAVTGLDAITGKLHRAEKELTKLEMGSRRKASSFAIDAELIDELTIGRART
jgi:hypothetical protein